MTNLVDRANAEEDSDIDVHLSRIVELAKAWAGRVVPTPDLSQIERGTATGDPELVEQIDKYKQAREQERKDNNVAKAKTSKPKAAKPKSNGNKPAAAVNETAAEPAVDPYGRDTDKDGNPLCMDGCGEGVGSLTSRFRTGHDSKLKSLILKVSRGHEPFEQIPEIGRAYAAEYAAGHDMKPWPPRIAVGAKANK